MMRCSNEECETRDDDDSPSFNVTIMVGEDGEPIEDLRKIQPEYLTCIHCQAQAEEVPGD